MGWRMAIAAVLVWGMVAPAQAVSIPSCPAGFNSSFNTNKVGCTFCSEATPDCHVECLGPPACFCPPNQLDTCCAANPCCDNCPVPKPLQCSLSQCTCEPGSCCSTLCPVGAPTTGYTTTALLVVLLTGFGVFAVRRRHGRAIRGDLR